MTATSLALITGANKGIGFEVARQLGALGVTVLVAARDAERGTVAERSLRDLGVDAHHVALDVTDQASVDQAAQQIGAQYGRLDVLVNNAGITGGPESGRPSQTPLAILRQVYETNVFGVVAVTNAMLPLLRQALVRVVGQSAPWQRHARDIGTLGRVRAARGPARLVADHHRRPVRHRGGGAGGDRRGLGSSVTAPLGLRLEGGAAGAWSHSGQRGRPPASGRRDNDGAA
jgi:NAD(P)-dependent dehydrogenase (short-subunit alcohol dehydrogenase family)